MLLTVFSLAKTRSFRLYAFVAEGCWFDFIIVRSKFAALLTIPFSTMRQLHGRFTFSFIRREVSRNGGQSMHWPSAFEISREDSLMELA